MRHLLFLAGSMLTVLGTEAVVENLDYQAEQYEQILDTTIEASDGAGSAEWWKAANWLIDYYAGQHALDTLIVKLEALEKTHPQVGSIYTCLAVAHKRNGDSHGVVGAYERAIQSFPSNLHFRLQLGAAYEEAGLTEEALKVFEEMTELWPDHSAGYSALATLQYRLGRPVEASQTIGRAKENLPRDESWLVDIGDMYSAVDAYSIAESLYLEAIEAAPEIVATYHGSSNTGPGSKLGLRLHYARKCEEWGRLEEAERQYRLVLAGVTDDYVKREVVRAMAAAWTLADTLQEKLSSNERISHDLKVRAVELRALNSGATAGAVARAEAERAAGELIEQGVFLALMYGELGKREGAARVYEQILEALPDNKDIWKRFIDVCKQYEFWRKAITGYDRLTEIDSENRNYYLIQLSSLHGRLGDKERSLFYAEEYVKEAPDEEASHNAAASLYELNQEHEKSAEHLKRAIELGVDPIRISDYRLMLARTYRTLGEYTLAEREYEMLLNEPASDLTKQRAREELVWVREQMRK